MPPPPPPWFTLLILWHAHPLYSCQPMIVCNVRLLDHSQVLFWPICGSCWKEGFPSPFKGPGIDSWAPWKVYKYGLHPLVDWVGSANWAKVFFFCRLYLFTHQIYCINNMCPITLTCNLQHNGGFRNTCILKQCLHRKVDFKKNASYTAMFMFSNCSITAGWLQKSFVILYL